MEFLLNMVENDDSNLQAKFRVHITFHKYFQNNPILKSRDRTNPPDLPTLKAYPTPPPPGKLVSSKFFR